MGLGNLESQRRELHHVVLIDFYPRREDTKRVRQQSAANRALVESKPADG